MAQPSLVQLKRKRNEEPLEYLLLQGTEKGINSPRYVRQKKEEDAVRDRDTDVQNPLQLADQTNGERQSVERQRRVFHLQHGALPSPVNRKRKDVAETAEIATFVEKKQRNRYDAAARKQEVSVEEDVVEEKPLKRPGKGSSLRTPTKSTQQAPQGLQAQQPMPAETDTHRKEMEALAAYMHSAALSTLSPPTRPSTISTPKLSGQRSAQLHRQRAATNGSMNLSTMDIDDEDSYVYDTYILAASPASGAIELDSLDSVGNVGYLVINEDDRSLWEMYLEDDGPSDEGWDSEEDDENAENYYAAEYPDEEEWSGSEEGFGVGKGRGWAGDEECYGGFEGSSEEEEEEVGRGELPRRLRRFEVEALGR